MGIKKLFHCRRKAQRSQPMPQPLRIEGVAPAPLTPEPDDAEEAAAALLELMASNSKIQATSDASSHKHKDKTPDIRDAAYYRQLAEHFREAHRRAMLRTMRFVSFAEQELLKPNLPAQGPGSLALLEAELYKRIDVIDRYGGELKRRWQHCLAEVTVRLMQATDEAEKH